MTRQLRIVAVLIGLAGLLTPASAVAATTPRIEVLSNRADLVSGGDALVRVTPPGATVQVAGRDVTSAFKTQNGAYEGLITGLSLGKNLVTARLAGGRAAQITIDNHPIGGPIFSGPQIQPWVCNTQSPPQNSGTAPTVAPVGLGPPLDAQCNTRPAISYVYKNANAGDFETYDPANPPADSDIATTTTDQGKTVPYIVRQEFGVQDRGIYAIAVLDAPGAWNHKLLTYFGASTAPDHLQSQPSKVLDDMVLSRGFMAANSSMNVNGQNTNQNVSAEALMMLKEHIVESYGPIRYTIGQGCSGGSYQYMLASMYPGLLDGLQPNCSYTDLWTTAPDVIDCGLIMHYFEANPHMPWVPEIDGHRDPSDCSSWDALFYNVEDPTQGANNCKLTDAEVYDPAARPDAVRCTIQDYQEAIWGPRPRSEWGNVEKQVGHGFANRPWGNEGVQYGLKALQDGKITAAEFVDLNSKIGGLDIDHKPQAERSAVDPQTAAIAYRTSQVTDARQLATVPIIDLRAYSETGEIHTSFYSYRSRARLDKYNGQHDNQLIWTFPAAEPIIGVSPPPDITLKSFLLMDNWLSRIEADKSGESLAEKVVRDKPSDATDKCFTGSAAPPAPGTTSGPTTEIDDPATCASLYPHYGDTRTAAGGPMTDDIIQCELKPIDPKEYGVTLTDEQLATLRKAFPNGVCDYSKPGVGQQPSVPWMSFAGGPGGKPLGPAPKSKLVGPTACKASSGFRAAGISVVRHRRVHVSFAQRKRSPLSVEIVRQGRAGQQVVARFKHVVKPFVWNGRANLRGRKVTDGVYVLRLRLGGDTRRFAVLRSHGRFHRRPPIERLSNCGLIRALRLDRAAVSGLVRLSYRLRQAATVRVTVFRGQRVVRRRGRRAASCRPLLPAAARRPAARRPAHPAAGHQGIADRHRDRDREAPAPGDRPMSGPVAVVGAGTLGRRIALMLATQGEEVRVFDISPAQRAAAAAFVEAELPGLLAGRPDGAAGRVIDSADLAEAVADAWFVVEAVPERLEPKRETFAELDRVAAPDAILATNSSSFPSSRLVDAVSRPERLVNTHFYMPPRVNAVEVMSCGHTERAVIDRLIERLPAYGFEPFEVRGESVGFIYNRIWAAIKREALTVVAEGVATPEEVDRIFRVASASAANGPFRTMDLVGLDVVLDIEEHYAAVRDSIPEDPRRLLADYIDRGRLGVKTGKGFYDDYAAEPPHWA